MTALHQCPQAPVNNSSGQYRAFLFPVLGLTKAGNTDIMPNIYINGINIGSLSVWTFPLLRLFVRFLYLEILFLNTNKRVKYNEITYFYPKS